MVGERSVALARETGNRYHLAIRLSVFGEILRGIGDLDQAGAAFLEGLALARTVDAQLPLLMCLRGLGDVTRRKGDLPLSRQYLLDALLSAVVPQVLPGALGTLVFFAALLLQESEALRQEPHAQQEKQERAFELLTVVRDHPLCWKTWQNQATALEQKLAAELPAGTIAAIRAPASQRTLEDVVAEILRREVVDLTVTPGAGCSSSAN